jgi:hypothetical protein
VEEQTEIANDNAEQPEFHAHSLLHRALAGRTEARSTNYHIQGDQPMPRRIVKLESTY